MAIGVGPRSKLSLVPIQENICSESQVVFASFHRDPQMLDVLVIPAGVHLYEKAGAPHPTQLKAVCAFLNIAL